MPSKKRYPNRIKLYTFKKNKGAFFAANFVLPKARGRYIAMMDADDVADKDRIAKQVRYLIAHPRTIVLGTQANIIDKRGKVIGKKHFQPLRNTYTTNLRLSTRWCTRRS